jgi:type II secretory pathway component GspD/PulD (secretin)
MGGGGQGAGRGFRSTTQLNIAEQGKVEGVSGILNVVRKMIAGVPGSEAYLTDGSGRLMVKSNRDMQTQVREFIRAENTNMLKQVHIQLDVYSVTLSQDNEVGVDWSIFYNRLTRNSGVSVLSPGSLVGNAAGSVTFRAADGSFTRKDPALFGTPQYEDPLFALRSTSIISALNEIGRNVQHRPVSMIALNRQWARKARLTSTGYLSETVPATSGALGGVASLPGLRTDTVTTGDQFAVMPYVLDSNTVMLKFGISLSDLLGLFDVTSGSGVNLQRVQTPNTSTLSDQFTVALRPGEIMAITGLSRELSAAQQRTLAEEAPLFTGGSRKLRKFHEHFVVFLRVVSI